MIKSSFVKLFKLFKIQQLKTFGTHEMFILNLHGKQTYNLIIDV